MNIEIKTAYAIYVLSVIYALLLIMELSSASIDIYYPDNSTTEIWVANDTNPEYDY